MTLFKSDVFVCVLAVFVFNIAEPQDPSWKAGVLTLQHFNKATAKLNICSNICPPFSVKIHTRDIKFQLCFHANVLGGVHEHRDMCNSTSKQNSTQFLEDLYCKAPPSLQFGCSPDVNCSVCAGSGAV